MRVLEDFARFVLDDGDLSGLAKRLRHDLSDCIGSLDMPELLASRDTPGDVGTSISTVSELSRADVASVVFAAAKRLSEALRCLAEYTKIHDGQLAGRIELIRYRSYDLEKRLSGRIQLADRFAGVGLYVLLSSRFCAGDILQVAEQVLAGGADCIQLREKDISDAELLELATAVSRLCRQSGVLFVMNDRVDITVLSGADGVHLGQGDLPIAAARRLLPSHVAIGKSTHSIAEATGAIAASADYLAVGSIFASGTKPDVNQSGPALITRIRELCGRRRPIIAIGGITAENAASVIAAGATGVAVCQSVTAAADPTAAAAAIKSQVVSAGRAVP